MIHLDTSCISISNGADESTSLLPFYPDASGSSVNACPETENSELGLSFSISDANNAFVKYDSVTTAEIAKQEARVLLKSSIQVALAFLLQYSFSFVNVMSLGHLGATELAAAALANMTVYMVVNAPACGLASALETFCSTSFTGSRDKTLVGFHLQRGIISVTIHFILTLPVLINIEPIFIYLRQDPQIAHLCGRFIRAQLPGMLPWIYFECIRCFLQAQRHMNASTYAMGVALPIHLVSTYFLVWSQRFGIGFIGAAVANVGTFWATFLGIVVYCRYTDVRAAWGGWTRRAFVTMPEYYRLALPSIVMVCSDWIGWELMAITASYLGNTTLAAQSIAINTCPITYQWANGLRTAISNRTGNLLGQTRARRAEISSAVGLCLGAAWGVISMAIYISAANWWGHVYTKDTDVISVVSVIMPFCGIFQLGDCMNAVSGGVLRSFGKQAAGALISFPSYYIIGLPLGLYLTYGRPELGVIGLWIGLCASVYLTAVGQTFICLRANYTKEVEKCLNRIEMSQHSLSDNSTTF